MDRRKFLATGALSTAGVVFSPGNLLAKEEPAYTNRCTYTMIAPDIIN